MAQQPDLGAASTYFIFPFAAAFLFLAAHAFFIVSDIFFRNAASFADNVLGLAAAGVFAGGVLESP